MNIKYHTPALFLYALYLGGGVVSAGLAEAGGDGEEELEVDAGHGAGEDREVVFVEEVVDSQFQL